MLELIGLQILKPQSNQLSTGYMQNVPVCPWAKVFHQEDITGLIHTMNEHEA